jgi:hypothetical protein
LVPDYKHGFLLAAGGKKQGAPFLVTGKKELASFFPVNGDTSY